MSANPFIGQITVFASNFVPRGWATCEGQLLSISSNTALFSLLGTTYGGDGRSSFGLPDARGRSFVNPGRGSGLSNQSWGQRGGTEGFTLIEAQMPSHNHTYNQQLLVSDEQGDLDNPSGSFIGQHDGAFNEDPGTVRNLTTANTGNSQSIAKRDPYLAMYVGIAIFGVYPSRS